MPDGLGVLVGVDVGVSDPVGVGVGVSDPVGVGDGVKVPRVNAREVQAVGIS